MKMAQWKVCFVFGSIACLRCGTSMCDEYDKKYSIEAVHPKITAVAAGLARLSTTERVDIANYIDTNKLDDDHSTTLVMLLFVSLQNEKDRPKESSLLAETIERVAAKSKSVELWGACMGCIAFSFEDSISGEKREVGWMQRIASESEHHRNKFLEAISNTKCSNPENRFLRMKALFDSESVSDSTRVAIIDVVYSGMLSGAVSVRSGFSHYRDLSELRSCSDRIEKHMFTRICDVAEASRVLSKANAN